MNLSFTFGSNIRNVNAALGGFDIGFTNGDHHLLRTQIDAAVVSVSGTTAVVRVTFSIRDSSGTFDDPFSGFVDALAVADLV